MSVRAGRDRPLPRRAHRHAGGRGRGPSELSELPRILRRQFDGAAAHRAGDHRNDSGVQASGFRITLPGSRRDLEKSPSRSRAGRLPSQPTHAACAFPGFRPSAEELIAGCRAFATALRSTTGREHERADAEAPDCAHGVSPSFSGCQSRGGGGRSAAAPIGGTVLIPVRLGFGPVSCATRAGRRRQGWHITQGQRRGRGSPLMTSLRCRRRLASAGLPSRIEIIRH